MRWNLAVAALACSWGLISVIVAAVDLDASVLVFWRVALAAATVVLAAALLGRGGLLRLPERAWRLAVVGVVLAVHWLLFFLTIKLSTVAVAVLTVYTAPLFLALLAPLALPEARSRVALVALVPAVAGIVLVALAGDDGGGSVRPLAIATGLGAAATYALLVVGTKRLRYGLHSMTIVFWSYVTTALVLVPLLITSERALPESGREALALLALGVVFTGISGILYVSVLGHVTAQAAGILAFLEPVSAALLAWAILDEPLPPLVVVGGALVLAAGVLVVLREPADVAAVEVVPVAPEPE